MRILVQRVNTALVSIEGVIHSSIGRGLLVFIGIEDADGMEDVQWLSQKIINLRIFKDEEGVMNKSLLDMNGELLLVSQFTLHAAIKKGNRPSYIRASKPPVAIPLYESMIRELTEGLKKPIATGVFGADMQVALENDGPVTIWIDSKVRE